MYSVLSDLEEFLTIFVGALGAYFIPCVLAVILFLAIRHDNKKRRLNNQQAQPSTNNEVATTANTPAPVAPPKKKNPYTSLNVLLICGSILLVSAMISFMENTNSKLVAPTAITLTLIFYIIGFVIYKFVDYLKPVGLCFAYTATAVFPFWVISFMSFGVATQASWILASIISLLAFIATSILFKSKVMPFFVYLWMLVLAWSCTPTGNTTASLWWAFAAPGALALVPSLIYRGRPNWLPVNFRKATQVAAYGFYPVIFFGSLLLYIIPGVASEAPFLRSTMAILAIVYSLLFWTKGHKYGWFIVSRFAVQALLFACTADALDYSLYDHYYNYSYSDKQQIASLAVAVVWAISFLAQALIALFIPKKDQQAKTLEHVVEVISLVGVLGTPIFTIGFDTETVSLVTLIVLGIVSILGVAYSIIHKNILWSIATLVGLLFIPIVISEGFETIEWTNWATLIYFIFYGLLVLLGYKLSHVKQAAAFPLAILALMMTSFILLIAAVDVGYIEIAWLVIAIYLAALGYLSESKVLYELSIYAGAFCVFALVGTIGETVFRAIPGNTGNVLPYGATPKCAVDTYYSTSKCITIDNGYYQRHENLVLGLNLIRAYIIPLALLGVSLWKERKLPESKKWRFIVAYIILSLSLLGVGWSGDGYWMLASLITQVLFLIYAVLADHAWLVWSSIAVLLISMLSLTGGFTYIWFGVIGIILIMVVIWRLTKLNAAKQREEAKKQE